MADCLKQKAKSLNYGVELLNPMKPSAAERDTLMADRVNEFGPIVVRPSYWGFG